MSNLYHRRFQGNISFQTEPSRNSTSVKAEKKTLKPDEKATLRERKRELEEQLNTTKGSTGELLSRTQEAMREFEQNVDFKRWWHKNFKPNHKITDGKSHNPDLGPAQILEGFEEWVRNGRPKSY